MFDKLNIKTANWNCPSVESRNTLRPDQETLKGLADPETVIRMVEETVEELGSCRYILPVWQNLESVVYGSRIQNDGAVWIPGDYCIEDLSDIEDFEWDLLQDPMIRTLLEVIPHYRDKPLVLEVESPFSILSALMNPIDLYMCFEEEADLLKEILDRIAHASAAYIKACLEAGCRLISLADPVGTMNLIGEDYYREFCASSELALMNEIDPFLDRAIVHICLKMSQSLVIAGKAQADPYEVPPDAGDYVDILYAMADDPGIHFTGMTCMHNKKPNLKKSYKIGIG